MPSTRTPSTPTTVHGLASAWLFLSDLHASPREAMPRAQAAVMQVLQRNEASADAHVSLGVIKMQYDWDFAGADREFARALELDPDDTDGRMLRGCLRMAEERLADARADMQRAVDEGPSSELEQTRRLLDTPQVVAALVHAQAAAGRRGEAQATMTSLLEYAKRKYVSPYDLATASAGLGDRTETLAWLEKAYEERSGWLALAQDRSDVRFTAR